MTEYDTRSIPEGECKTFCHFDLLKPVLNIGYRQLLWPLLNPPLLKISVGSKSGNSEHYYLLICITF